jgi:hypothetical protein
MRRSIACIFAFTSFCPALAQVVPDPTPPPAPSIFDQSVIPTTAPTPYDGPVMSTRPPIAYPQNAESPGETNPANDLPLPSENFPETETPNSPAVPTMTVP